MSKRAIGNTLTLGGALLALAPFGLWQLGEIVIWVAGRLAG